MYDAQSARLLLGALLIKPTFILDEKYPLNKADFSANEFHQRLYQAINALAKKGCQSVSAIDVYNLCRNNPTVKRVFDDNDLSGFIDTIKQLVNIDNYVLYYEAARKCSLLNSYGDAGFNISKFEHDIEKYSIEDIVQYYEGQQIAIRKQFYQDKSVKEYKAGDGFTEIKEGFKVEPMYGASTFSPMVNTITRGWIPGQLSVYGMPSGTGKSTIGLYNLVKVCCPEIWDDKSDRYIANPCYQHKGGLYLEWEMDAKREVTPKIISSISGVGTRTILNGKYQEGEEERVDKAIDILNRSNIYIVCMPNFTVDMIESYVKDYVINHNVQYIVYDYITDGASAFNDFAKKNGVSTRSDQALAAIASKLKDIAVDLNVAIMSFTQVNANINTQEILDAGVIAGSRAIQNTCDILGIMSPLRKQEQEVCDMVMESKLAGSKIKPNRVLSMAKVRFGSEEQGIKVWCFVDLNTGHVTDMFATNKFNQLINLTSTNLIYKNS